MNWRIKPSPPPVGVLSVPGDKSISHRVAMLAALADGTSHVRSFLTSSDCLNTLTAMSALGAGITRKGTEVEIKGTDGKPQPPTTDLDMGNSGTAMRLLTGLVAGFPVRTRLFGDASLNTRPMRRILDPLALMGADILAEGAEGRAPLVIQGSTLTGIEYRLPVASAQVKSCILLAGLRAEGITRIIEPVASRDHTERLLRAMGLPLTVSGNAISLTGTSGQPLKIPARNWSIPGDISSAAFWFVAAAIRPGASVTVRNLGLNPSRTALLDVLRAMGAAIEIGPLREADWEPQADVTVIGSQLRATEICGSAIPNLIDEIPILCVAAAFAEGTTHVRDAAELRVKESDRIESTAAMLRAAGIAVETRPDGLSVTGGSSIRGAAFDSFGDHRIAMAAAVLAMAAETSSTISDVACVDASYPEFAAHLAQLAPDSIETVSTP